MDFPYNNATNSSWYHYRTTIEGNYNKGVRLAYDGTNCCILLGTTSSTWNYPKVYLKSVFAGYSNLTAWRAGYSISLITSESGISAAVTPELATGQFSQLNVAGRATIGDAYTAGWYRSVGNVGWYSETYSGGIYMIDSTYVRLYNYKSFYVESTINATSPTSSASIKTVGGLAVAQDIWATNIAATGSIAALSTSDRRLKRDLKNVDAIGILLSFGDLQSFKYSEKAKMQQPTTPDSAIGFMYQDVKEVLPQMSYERGGYGALNYLNTDYINLIAGGVQQLAKKLTKEEQRINELEKEVKTLKTEINELKGGCNYAS